MFLLLLFFFFAITCLGEAGPTAVIHNAAHITRATGETSIKETLCGTVCVTCGTVWVILCGTVAMCRTVCVTYCTV